MENDFHGRLGCPRCKSSLKIQNGRFVCDGCGAVGLIRAERLADFVDDSACADSERVASLPGDFLTRAEPWLVGLVEKKADAQDGLAELRQHGLADGEGKLTSLGGLLAYHLAEFRAQARQDQFLPASVLASLTPGGQVLDIGCGAGQTLRRLPGHESLGRVGLDVDLAALTLGCRLGEAESAPIHFVRASGAALPFRDRQFSHVLCRVALNYMHQPRALRELARVLQPGGWLYCHVEGPGFDLRRLVHSGMRSRLGALRDFFFGMTLALAGWQPAPGTRWSGGRAFSSRRRLGKILRAAGCGVLETEVTERYGLLPLSIKIVGRRNREP